MLRVWKDSSPRFRELNIEYFSRQGDEHGSPAFGRMDTWDDEGMSLQPFTLGRSYTSQATPRINGNDWPLANLPEDAVSLTPRAPATEVPQEGWLHACQPSTP